MDNMGIDTVIHDEYCRKRHYTNQDSREIQRDFESSFWSTLSYPDKPAEVHCPSREPVCNVGCRVGYLFGTLNSYSKMAVK